MVRGCNLRVLKTERECQITAWETPETGHNLQRVTIMEKHLTAKENYSLGGQNKKRTKTKPQRLLARESSKRRGAVSQR